MPLTRPELFAFLDRLGIAHRTVEHPAAATVEDGHRYWAGIPGGHAKNLFVKDKKSRLYLITLRADAPLELKRTHPLIGATGRLSFCTADQLMDHLGVAPGSVTPFGAANDRAGAVTVILERRLMAMTPVNFHPLENTATTSIAPGDLLVFLRATGHEPRLVDLPIAGESHEPPSDRRPKAVL